MPGRSHGGFRDAGHVLIPGLVLARRTVLFAGVRCIVHTICALFGVHNVFGIKIIFKRFYLLIFRERGREGEKGKHQCVVAHRAPPTGDLAPTQACALTGNQITALRFAGPHSSH